MRLFLILLSLGRFEAGALTVLFDVVFNNDAIAPGMGDPRFTSIIEMGRELRRRGHRVLMGGTNPSTEVSIALVPAAQAAFAEFDRPTDANASPYPDCAVFWSNFKGASARARASKVNTYNVTRAIWGHRGGGDGKTPFVVYENGFTKGSVTVDPRGLLGDSFFVESLNEVVQKGYDATTCSEYIEDHLAHDSSKRPQINELDIPESILGRYVFVPTQKFADVSVLKFSDTTYPAMLEETVRFCSKKGLSLVIKIHPHLKGDERRQQAKLITSLNRALQEQVAARSAEMPGPVATRVYESKASINLLTRNALFTVTLNGGTLVDNFFTNTPVLTLAKSVFQKTDAVVAESDVNAGLERMASMIKDGRVDWSEIRRQRQRQIVCWYDRKSFNWKRSAPDNLGVLEFHFGALGSPISFS